MSGLKGSPLLKVLLAVAALGVGVEAWILYGPNFRLGESIIRTGGVVSAVNESPSGEGAIELVSLPYELKRRYQSMEGPASYQLLRLRESLGGDDVIWLTGLSVDLYDETLTEAVSKEFFCHSNLTISRETGGPDAHNAGFGTPTNTQWRLFTLVPGKWDIRLPEGFGVPIRSQTTVDNFTMALNQNPRNAPKEIRMKTTVHYDRGETRPMKSLFMRGLTVYQQHKEVPEPELCELPTQAHSGEACAISEPDNQLGEKPSLFESLGFGGVDNAAATHPGASCCVVNASEGGIIQQFGDANTIHWMVPPGRHVYRSEVTEQLKLPGTTSAHYITGHLHPTGEWLKLVDLTTGETVVSIESKDFDDRWGVKQMTEIASEEGIVIHEDHRYELVTQYLNTTDKPVDVMAILYLYLLEPGDPTPEQLTSL